MMANLWVRFWRGLPLTLFILIASGVYFLAGWLFWATIAWVVMHGTGTLDQADTTYMLSQWPSGALTALICTSIWVGTIAGGGRAMFDLNL